MIERTRLRTEATMQRHLVEMELFRKEHGHLFVPFEAPWRGLAIWQRDTRAARRQNRLSQEEIEQLDAAGFLWEPRNAKEDSAMQAMKEFQSEFGHCNVPFGWRRNLRLARWVTQQRQQYKQENHGGIPASRIAALEALGFEWAPYEGEWRRRVADLAAFKREHGHCRVPSGFGALGRWCEHRREDKKANRLSVEHVVELETLGFEWELRAVRDHAVA